MPRNVRHLGHVYTREHNAFNTTPLAVLNIARDSMAAVGFSPATRVFEAAGAGACLITDAWAGLDLFLDEGDGGAGRARRRRMSPSMLAALTPERARAIGEAARAPHPGRAHLRPPRRRRSTRSCARRGAKAEARAAESGARAQR